MMTMKNSILVTVFLLFQLSFWSSVSMFPVKPQSIVGGYHSMQRWRSVFSICEDFFETLWNKWQLVTPVRCTGSFISPNAIITAAHCFNHSNKSPVYLQIRRTDGPLYKAAATIYVHPQFCQKSLRNDLAILVLATWPQPIKPLVIDMWPTKCGEPLTLYGFGRTTENEPTFGEQLENLVTSPELRELPVKVDSFFCEETKRIVTQADDGTGCYGDSGGPLLRRGKLVGITSHIATSKAGVCVRGASNYAMPIANYLDFIAEIVPDVQIA